MDLAERLQELRKEAGYSQEKLALEKKIPLIYPYREKHKNKPHTKMNRTA